ncbi:hypothetical protein DFH94DRAFT_349446 [Russula ochroleuca]|uniref:Uncharacterized protein n=1 Tax=Russula ochroleuca TaxID=152965 RepID=A0A9P5JUU0_9AGAM|nr:hypothetical protein DFH94DRAFT_349446 [Russula ochroleuca]
MGLTILPCAPIRVGQPLGDGLPPPGLRGGLSKGEKEGAQVRETEEKEDEHQKDRLMDSANAGSDPTTSYAPEVMQYPKLYPESSVRRTHSSFRDHEHDSSAAAAAPLPDTSDSRGKMGPGCGAFKVVWPWMKRKKTNVTRTAPKTLPIQNPQQVMFRKSCSN